MRIAPDRRVEVAADLQAKLEECLRHLQVLGGDADDETYALRLRRVANAINNVGTLAFNYSNEAILLLNGQASRRRARKGL